MIDPIFHSRTNAAATYGENRPESAQGLPSSEKRVDEWGKRGALHEEQQCPQQ